MNPILPFRRLPRLLSLAAALLLTIARPASAQDTERGVGHLQLMDRLDRPQDGYCLDILGTGTTLRLELPVLAHNCKPALTPDSALTITGQGEVLFVAVGLCVTVFGVNGQALPGSPIMLRPCGHDAPFFQSAPLQRFTWSDEGRLHLSGTALCLSVGSDAATTYSQDDRWRQLTVQPCDSVPAARSRWEFVRLT